jgi:hypothetical protein
MSALGCMRPFLSSKGAIVSLDMPPAGGSQFPCSCPAQPFLADSLPEPCVVRSQLACIHCGGTSCGGLAVACVIKPHNSMC